MRPFPIAAAALLLFCLLGSLRAQPAALQQLQNDQLARSLKTQAAALTDTNALLPELFPGEDQDVGPQHLLRQNRRWKYFAANFDSQLLYSDNATYEPESTAVASPVYVNALQATITLPPVPLNSGTLSASGGFVSQWYNYGETSLSRFDFMAQTLFLSGKYTLDSWQLTAGANFTRIVDQADYNESYREYLPNLAIQRSFALGSRIGLTLNNQINYHFSKVPPLIGSLPDINDRMDDIVTASLNWQPFQRLVFQPFYRFQYSCYPTDTLATSGRNDFLQNTGVTASYYFRSDVVARIFYSYTFKQSDDHYSPDYQEMNGGLGATLSISF